MIPKATCECGLVYYGWALQTGKHYCDCGKLLAPNTIYVCTRCGKVHETKVFKCTNCTNPVTEARRVNG